MQNIQVNCFQRQKPPAPSFSKDGTTVITFKSSSVCLEQVDGQISQGLVKRLVNFAINEVKEAGLEHILAWKISVDCDNFDEEPRYRHYTVSFENSKGTKIKLSGVNTSKGWPSHHYGFDIEA